MKFKKLLTVILLGTAILSTGCSIEKNRPQETSQSNVESTTDSDGSLNDEKIEEKENLKGLTMDFIQQPEELIVFDKESLDNFNVLNQEYYRILQNHDIKSKDDIPEEAKEIVSQMESEFNSRKRIHDISLIKLMYDDIINLKAEKVDAQVATDYYNNILFGFDFVDNKDLGKEGNSQKDYIRYLAVMKNNLIFIPIVEEHDDHEHIYYATATITDELFNILEDMVSE